MRHRRLTRLAIYLALFMAVLLSAIAYGILGNGETKARVSACGSEAFLREKEKLGARSVPNPQSCTGIFHLFLKKNCAPYAIHSLNIPLWSETAPFSILSSKGIETGRIRMVGRRWLFTRLGEARLAADDTHCYLIFPDAIFRKKIMT